MSFANLVIISEGPVAKHFKECVMISIGADNTQIVVFATYSNAFLWITRSFTRRHCFSKEDILELYTQKRIPWKIIRCFVCLWLRELRSNLVHASIDKWNGRITERCNWTWTNQTMIMVFYKIFKKCISNIWCCEICIYLCGILSIRMMAFWYFWKEHSQNAHQINEIQTVDFRLCRLDNLTYVCFCYGKTCNDDVFIVVMIWFNFCIPSKKKNDDIFPSSI